jgi:hypothetical protein
VADLSTASVFWSYAHADDDGSGGRIRKLSERVELAYRMHSGEHLRRFFDRDGEDGIRWAEQWRNKIRETIFGTTFFIPVVSPSYLRSPTCRDEFNQFWERANRSQLKDLLLPIIWVPVVKPATDEEQTIWDIVKEIQYVDWTKRRLLELKSTKCEQRIDQMGKRLAEISRMMADRPERLPEETAASNEMPSSPPPSSEVGGPALGQLFKENPEVIQITAKLTPIIKTFPEQREATKVALQSVVDVFNSEPLPTGASTGQRIIYLNATALRLHGPASEFEEAAIKLEATARSLNAVMFDFVDLLNKLTLSQPLKLNLTTFRQIPTFWLQQFGRYDEARHLISQMSGMSRSLQHPMSAIERGFDSLDAVKKMTEEWVVALELFANDSPQTGQGGD